MKTKCTVIGELKKIVSRLFGSDPYFENLADKASERRSSPSGVGWPLGLSQQEIDDIICERPNALEEISIRERIVVGSDEWKRRVEETRGKWDNLVDITPPTINWFCTYKICKCNPDEQAPPDDFYCGCFLLDDGERPNRCKECLAILSWHPYQPEIEKQQISHASKNDWQKPLENALGAASPKEVLDIIHSIKGWLIGYCITCGTYSEIAGGKINCHCRDKGEWDKQLAPSGQYGVWCEANGHMRNPEWLLDSKSGKSGVFVGSYEEAIKEADYCNRHNTEWNYYAKPVMSKIKYV